MKWGFKEVPLAGRKRIPFEFLLVFVILVLFAGFFLFGSSSLVNFFESQNSSGLISLADDFNLFNNNFSSESADDFSSKHADNFSPILTESFPDLTREELIAKGIELHEKTALKKISAKEKVESSLLKEINENPSVVKEVLFSVDSEENLLKLKKEFLSAKVFETGKIIKVSLKGNEILKFAENDFVKQVYPKKELYITLENSVSQINADVVWPAGFTGKGIKVAVLDTGINKEHEMLLGKVVDEVSFVENETANDLHGHGTHVAGIIAGSGSLKGVAPDAELLNIKVLNSQGVGFNADVIEGINYAVQHDVDIINLSLTGNYSDPSGPLNQAILDAIDSGVIVVVSAGNCSQGCNGFYGVGVPADNERAITVGSVDEFNEHALFSSGGVIQGVGIKPDVSAPGVNINSSYLNSYKSLSGTSMSAPFVSGVIALLMEKDSDLTPLKAKEFLELTSFDLGVQGKDVEFGSGLVNAVSLFDLESNDVPQIQTINVLPFTPLLNEKSFVVVRTWNNSLIPKGKLNDSLLVFEKASENKFIASFVPEKEGNNLIKVSIGSLSKEKSFVVVSSRLNDSKEIPEKIISVLNYSQKEEATDFFNDSLNSSFFEDDQSCAGAVSGITPDSVKFGPIDYPGDVDWYFGTVSKKTLLSLRLNSPENYNFSFHVYKSCVNGVPQGFVKHCFSASGNPECSVVAGSDNTVENFYVQVHGHTDLDFTLWPFVQDYKLTVSHACVPSFQCTNFINNSCVDSGILLNSNAYCHGSEWKFCNQNSLNCSNAGKYNCVFDGAIKKWSVCSLGCNTVQGVCKENETELVSCSNDSDCSSLNYQSCSAGKTASLSNTFKCDLASHECIAKVPLVIKECSSSNFLFCSQNDLMKIPGSSECQVSGKTASCTENNSSVPVLVKQCNLNCLDDGNGTAFCEDLTCPAEQCADNENNQCVKINSLNKDNTLFCQADVSFASCNSEIHNACQKINNYFCAQNDNSSWNWQSCDNGCNLTSGKCNPAEAVNLQLEESVSRNRSIYLYKQPNDFLTVKLSTGKIQIVSLLVPNDFSLQSGICNSNSFSIPAGQTICKYKVGNSLGTKTVSVQQLSQNGLTESKSLQVISKPFAVYLTDSKKLFLRFNDKIAVQSVLEKTFDNALNSKGIVYDLSNYDLGKEHPFASLSSYDLSKNKQIESNEYSITVSNFLKEKCKNCDNVILIGDDFVIPYFKQDISRNFEFLSQKYSSSLLEQTISTDLIYTSTKEVSFNNIDRIFDNEKIALVIPDSQYRTDYFNFLVDKIKQELVSQYSGINPNLSSINDIKVFSSNEIACNSFELGDYTLILIGNTQTNNAIGCTALTQLPKNIDSISIHKNQWSADKFAVILFEPDALNLNGNNSSWESFTAFTKIAEYGFHLASKEIAKVQNMSITEFAVACVTGEGSNSGAIYINTACNIIPFVELLPDAYDSGGCLLNQTGNFLTGKNDLVLNVYCNFMHAATALDVGQYAAFIPSGGASIALEGVDVVVSSGKSVVKSSLSSLSVPTLTVLSKVSFTGILPWFASMSKVGVKSFDEAVVILDKHGVESTAELSESLGVIVGKSSVDAGDKVVLVAVESTIKSADDVVKQTSQAVELGVLNPLKVSPDKGAQYMKAWNGNPLTAEAGEHQLIKMYNSPQTVTKVGLTEKEAITEIAILKEGSVTQKFGWKHVVAEDHHIQIKNAFNLSNNDEAVKEFIQEGLEKGIKDAQDPLRIIYAVPNNTHNLIIVLSKDSEGSIQTIRAIQR